MNDDPDPLTVGTDDRTSRRVEGLDRWCDVATTTLAGEGVAAGHLDLLFVDVEEMHQLNLAHMGVDRPTDVLAFPIDGAEENGPPDASGNPPRHLGDVVICPAVADEQAHSHAGSFDAELTLLIVHGILHVLGHDHGEPDETTVMQGRERHHLSRYGFGHPVPA